MNGRQFFIDTVESTQKDIDKQICWSMAISDVIADTLKSKGLSQRDFARLSGKTETEVSRWLSGTHNFTLSTLAKISSVLDKDLINV